VDVEVKMPNALVKTPSRKYQAKMNTPVISSQLPRAWRPKLVASLVYSTILAVACLLSYWVVSELLGDVHPVSKTDDVLGGLWAVISTAFVYRVSYQESHRAALSRISATLFSFALCLLCLLFTPYHLWGLALLVGVGAFVLILIGREDDIVTCTITTAVVMVVAGLSPNNAWQQPVLRLGDTVVGAVVGLAAAWAVLHLNPLWTS
jgi:uncharacterized membrane protein YgaE (UPF0421/DUF939 family)